MGPRESAPATAPRSSEDVVGGRYRLDRLLGSGGAADVHQGLDLKLRRPVAVKVFRPDTGIDIHHDAQREAVLLARLRHPGLVTAYDAGQDNGRAFLVMQLIEGTTLRRRIAQGPLPPRETAALGRDIARALAHAHDAGIVHRDVKPSNVLLDSAQQPYLTDFGISRLLDATSHTATGTLVGTAAYLAPEQVLGRRVGCPADVYALGLVVLECLTGTLEYDGGPLESAIARLHRAPVLPAGLPRQLGSLIEEMTALDEASRPGAEECARTLAAVAATAERTAPAAPATPVVTRPDVARTAGRTHPRQPRDGSPPPPAKPTRRPVLLIGTLLGTAALAATLAFTDGVVPLGPEQKATDATGSPVDKRSAGGTLAADTSPKTEDGKDGPSHVDGSSQVGGTSPGDVTARAAAPATSPAAVGNDGGTASGSGPATQRAADAPTSAGGGSRRRATATEPSPDAPAPAASTTRSSRPLPSPTAKSPTPDATTATPPPTTIPLPPDADDDDDESDGDEDDD